ncbi:ubiquinone/menaquinone biosynthesis C-methylase UbiE [Kribbella steppae]|uniref:Ubiquinone/menaquinone biosynthesis C-methylase UbiE n=1 Tax=Kribbella steppae TaxID=2512223 RepID=A0A4R2H8T3_9ACTN|nr:class I SAM-dependent methyltransferase [Kribbella steppae]TCO23387.1 ubiquinone/menaquinone biosynthesis C-methylase UbiE [Kribbella steppae]
MVDYNGRLSSVYAAGREMTVDEVQRWTAAIQAYLPEERPLTILDLGSGTGRLTPGLAEEFGGPVYGVEPSDRMREIAETSAAHQAVTYLRGSAEKIPLPEASVDGVLMFLSFHHFRDQLKALQEVHRVLKPGGAAFLRSQFADLMPDLFWYDYFPSAREVDAGMYRTLDESKALAEAAGLRPGEGPVWVSTEPPRTLRESYDRLKHRALSTFEHLPEAEIERGFTQLAADADQEPDKDMPVYPAAILVLRRPN